MLITLHGIPGRAPAELFSRTGTPNRWSRFVHSEAVVLIGVITLVLLRVLWWLFVTMMVVMLAITIGALWGAFAGSGRSYRRQRRW